MKIMSDCAILSWKTYKDCMTVFPIRASFWFMMLQYKFLSCSSPYSDSQCVDMQGTNQNYSSSQWACM